MTENIKCILLKYLKTLIGERRPNTKSATAQEKVHQEKGQLTFSGLANGNKELVTPRKRVKRMAFTFQ